MASNKEKGHFAFLKRNKVSMSDRSADEPQKHGSFKIDDGKVIGKKYFLYLMLVIISVNGLSKGSQ